MWAFLCGIGLGGIVTMGVMLVVELGRALRILRGKADDGGEWDQE